MVSDSLMTSEHHTNQDYALVHCDILCYCCVEVKLHWSTSGKTPETFEDQDQLLKLVELGVFCFKKPLSPEKTSCKILNCTDVQYLLVDSLLPLVF